MPMSFRRFSPWLDILAIASWGILFLKYWLTGKLYLLIHPNYMGLTIVAGIALLLVAGLKGVVLLKRRTAPADTGPHLTVFPPGFGSALLLLWAPA